jgi:hypothetical protein
VERAANFWPVIILAGVDSEDVVLIHFPKSPALRVGEFPTFESFFEVFAEDKWKVRQGLVGRDGCESKCD